MPSRSAKTPRSRVRGLRSQGHDSITLIGRERNFVISTTASGTITGATTVITPQELGDRPTAMQPLFARYRFKSLRFVFRSLLPTTASGSIVAGVLDDTSGSTTVLTPDQVMNLRTSRQATIYKDFSLNWRPLDAEKWYYTNNDPTTSDARFIVPCALSYVSDAPIGILGTNMSSNLTVLPLQVANPAYAVDIYYRIEFAGATSIAL